MIKYTATIEEDEHGEQFIVFPDDIMSEIGWVVGDTIRWIDNKDGTYTLTKKED